MKYLKEINRFKTKTYTFHESKPTGIDKGKSFKRKSKGVLAREARQYQQNMRTGELIKIK